MKFNNKRKYKFGFTDEDLIGDIEGFFPEVVELMLQRQKDQTGIVNIHIFQDYVMAGKFDGGFTWEDTCEKEDFWYDVINNMNFECFFDAYPKKYENK